MTDAIHEPTMARRRGTDRHTHAPNQSIHASNRSAYASDRRSFRRIRLNFAGALRSEAIKLWSLNSTKATLAISVILMIAMAALSAWSVTFMASINPATGKPLDEPQTIAAADVWSVLASSGTTAGLAIGILGVMAITTEFTTSAVQSSLTANPRRGMFFAAKSLIVAVTALLAGIIGILAAWGVITAMTAGLDIAPLEDGQWRIIPVVFIGFPVAMVLCAMLGLGLGGLTRSTVGGICALIGMLMILSSVLGITSMMASRITWLGTLTTLTPDSAMGAFLSAGVQGPAVAEASGETSYWVPEWWQSGLIFLAWVAIMWIAGLMVIRRADVK